MMQYSNKTILYTIETSVISLILTVRKTNILKRHPLNTPSVRFVGNSNITKVADSVKGATIGSNHTISTSIKTPTPSTSPNKGAAVSNTTKETSTTTTSNNTEVSLPKKPVNVSVESTASKVHPSLFGKSKTYENNSSTERVMSSNSVNTSVSSTPISKSVEVTVFKREYAVYTVNDADPNTTDPLALSNNPLIPKKGRHPETQRQECDNPACIGKVCTGLCGIPFRRKSVMHYTHGQSQVTETMKKTHKNITTDGKDINGNTHPQNGVFYADAHDTAATTERTNGTQKIHTDQKLLQTILTNEDTK